MIFATPVCDNAFVTPKKWKQRVFLFFNACIDKNYKYNSNIRNIFSHILERLILYDIFYLKRKRKNIYRYCTIYINATKFNFRKEINIIQWASCVRGIVKSFIVFMTRISLFITILSYILFGYKITAEKVYVITAYYNSLSLIMTAYFPQGMR